MIHSDLSKIKIMARLNNHGESDRPGRTVHNRIRGPASFVDDGSPVLTRLIDDIANCGGAIRFGKSRDGGALAIGVYGDGETAYTVYLGPNDDYLALLGEVAGRLVERKVRYEHAQAILKGQTPKQGTEGQI